MGNTPGIDSTNELKREAVHLAKASPPDLNAMLAHQKKMIVRLVILKKHLGEWRKLNAGIAAAEKSAPDKVPALKQERSKLEMLYRTLNDLQALHDSFIAVGNGLNKIIKKLKK
jgi:hypothetical protein